MTTDQVAQELAIGKHVVTYFAGVATAVGLLTQVDSATLMTSVDHIVEGVKQIAVGIGPLIGLGMGLWARYNATLAAKRAAVAAVPGTMVVQTGGNTVALANKLAALPEVHSVVSTPEVAAATASPKVVSS